MFLLETLSLDKKWGKIKESKSLLLCIDRIMILLKSDMNNERNETVVQILKGQTLLHFNNCLTRANKN